MVCRCVVIDVDDLLVVVDTGIGTRDIASPRRRLGKEWLDLINPVLDETETLAQQLKTLGYSAADVTDVVLTHAHRDHVGGVNDFPNANVHVFRPETADGHSGGHSTFDGHEDSEWVRGARWASRPVPDEPWRGLPTFVLDGLPRSVRYVPLPGHTADHAGVLVENDDGDFIFHVGDAVFHCNQYLGGDVPSGIAAFTEATQDDPEQRRNSEMLLREVSTWGDVRIVTAHCPD